MEERLKIERKKEIDTDNGREVKERKKERDTDNGREVKDRKKERKK